jgi:hypothetical protein
MSTATDTNTSGAQDWVNTFVSTVAKVAAGRGCSVEEASALVLAEVATDTVRFAKLVRSLEVVAAQR